MAVTLNPDTKVVEAIREGLKQKGGYCPCRLEKTEDTKCMCKMIYSRFIIYCLIYSR